MIELFVRIVLQIKIDNFVIYNTTVLKGVTAMYYLHNHALPGTHRIKYFFVIKSSVARVIYSGNTRNVDRLAAATTSGSIGLLCI